MPQHILKLFSVELAEVRVDLTLPWLINLWSLFLDSQVNIALYNSPFNVWLVQYEAHKFHHGCLGAAEYVFVPDEVDRDLCVKPELMEVLPNGDLLLHELVPRLVELRIVIIVNRLVVRTSADHVEKGCTSIQGVSHF